MSMNEKLTMLAGGVAEMGAHKVYSGETPENTRWGIPALRLNDGPQGFRMRNHTNGALGTTTQFPSGLSVGATWDLGLAYEWGNAMGQVSRLVVISPDPYIH
jgi:beta-glucosidase